MKKKDIIKSEPEKKPTKEDLLGVKIKPEKRLTKEEWYVDDPEALMRVMPRKKSKFVKVEKPSVKEEAAADAQAEVKEEPQVKEEAPAILAPAADVPEELEEEPPEEEEGKVCEGRGALSQGRGSSRCTSRGEGRSETGASSHSSTSSRCTRRTRAT